MSIIVLSTTQLSYSWRMCKKEASWFLGHHILHQASGEQAKIPSSFIPQKGTSIPVKEGLYNVLSTAFLEKSVQIPWLLCAQKKHKPQKLEPTVLFHKKGSFCAMVHSHLFVLSSIHNPKKWDFLNVAGEPLHIVGPQSVYKAYILHQRLMESGVSSKNPSSPVPKADLSPEKNSNTFLPNDLKGLLEKQKALVGKWLQVHNAGQYSPNISQ